MSALQITLEQYFMGRDKKYPGDLTDEIKANAEDLVERVNLLLFFMGMDGVFPGMDETTKTPVASGWRPPAVNDSTRNAGKASNHLIGNAVDLQDRQDRRCASWCLKNLQRLEDIGLWMEDPQWTPDWVHLQRVPPGSGRRVYIPSQKPPLIAKLPEQLNLA